MELHDKYVSQKNVLIINTDIFITIEARLFLWKQTGLCNKDTNMVMRFGI
jgi:hypothetical protein